MDLGHARVTAWHAALAASLAWRTRCLARRCFFFERLDELPAQTSSRASLRRTGPRASRVTAGFAVHAPRARGGDGRDDARGGARVRRAARPGRRARPPGGHRARAPAHRTPWVDARAPRGFAAVPASAASPSLDDPNDETSGDVCGETASLPTAFAHPYVAQPSDYAGAGACVPAGDAGSARRPARRRRPRRARGRHVRDFPVALRVAESREPAA